MKIAIGILFIITIALFYYAAAKKASKTLYGTSYTLHLRKKPSDINSLIQPVAEGLKTNTPFAYPWKQHHTAFSPITKEYFRCKGSPLHPPIPTYNEGKIVHNLFDCNGSFSHSLPIRNEKEFIYPILIELLNHIQNSLKESVVITSGHRCPTHNSYVDPSIKNQFSKQIIGAEVHFYIQNIENSYALVIQEIEQFYRTNLRYARAINEYLPLIRYERDQEASIQPWMNKEIFIRFYRPNEGRNRDDSHPYSYFSLQVRFDRDRQAKVIVTPQESAIYRQS